MWATPTNIVARLSVLSIDGDEYTVTVIEEPREGAITEGVIEVSPAVIVGPGLVRAMRILKYDTHGATFEHAISGAKDDGALVVVNTVPQHQPDTIPGFGTGHELVAVTAQERWRLAVASFRAFLNDADPPT